MNTEIKFEVFTAFSIDIMFFWIVTLKSCMQLPHTGLHAATTQKTTVYMNPLYPLRVFTTLYEGYYENNIQSCINKKKQ